MLKKANYFTRKWKHKKKKKKDNEAENETSESSSFKEDVRSSVETDDKPVDYDEKLRMIREDLNAKYNEQIDGMKKREASNNLRMNTRLACIARQRDEMEAKLHLVEKKYENMKKQMSKESSSTILAPETVTKDGRSVDNNTGAVDSASKLGLVEENGQPTGKMACAEKDLGSVKEWTKDTNEVIKDIREKLTDIQNALSVVRKKFDKFLGFHESKKSEISEKRDGGMERKCELTNTKCESQDKCPGFKVETVGSDNAEIGASTTVRHINITDDRKGSKHLSMKLSEHFSENCSTKINEELEGSVDVPRNSGHQVEEELIQHVVKDEAKISNSCQSRFKKRSKDEKCQIQKETGDISESWSRNPGIFSEKMDASSGNQVAPSDLSEDFAFKKVSSEKVTVKEESAAEGDLKGHFRFDGVGVDLDVAADVTTQLEVLFIRFLNRFQQLYEKVSFTGRQKVANPPVCKKKEDETKSFQRKLGMPGHDNKSTKACEFTMGKTERKEDAAYKHNCHAGHSDKGPTSLKCCTVCLTDNFTKRRIRCSCTEGCSICHTQSYPKARAEKCSRWLSETCTSSSMGSCPVYRMDWYPKCLYGDFLTNDNCRTVNNGLLFSDYIQRHVVKSSRTIAELRDLKPGEYW